MLRTSGPSLAYFGYRSRSKFVVPTGGEAYDAR
jgi:hypothetical protein